MSEWWLTLWSVVGEKVGAAGVVGVRGGADARGAAGVGAWVEIGVDVRAVVGVQ